METEQQRNSPPGKAQQETVEARLGLELYASETVPGYIYTIYERDLESVPALDVKNTRY
jgi:hypothetical protein